MYDVTDVVEEGAAQLEDDNPVFRNATGFTREQELLWNRIFRESYADAVALNNEDRNTCKLVDRVTERLSGIEHDDLVKIAAVVITHVIVNT